MGYPLRNAAHVGGGWKCVCVLTVRVLAALATAQVRVHRGGAVAAEH